MNENMKQNDILLNSWDEFCEYIDGSRENYETEYNKNLERNWQYLDEYRINNGQEPFDPEDPSLQDNNLKYYKLLYRGHECSSWNLQTTLERKIHTDNLNNKQVFFNNANVKESLNSYLEIRKYIQSLQEIHKNLSYLGEPPTEIDFEEWLRKPDWLSLNLLNNYNYLEELRHNGYPSPLMDWSRNAFKAAFFAFQHPSSEDCVAICVLKQLKGIGFLSTDTNIAFLRSQEATERIKAQEGEMTLCIQQMRQGLFPKYISKPHHEAFKVEAVNNCTLERVLLPSSLRKEFLQKLDNRQDEKINAQTLYPDSKDALMETLANRAMFFNN